MTETWKDVKGYEGAYQVSNLGNVRSLHWRGTDEIHLMSQRKQNKGYFKVLLSSNGVHKYELVHRLVAMAFVPNPMGMDVVNHIDENKTNNTAENLEWCSLVENVHKYCFNHGKSTCGRRYDRSGRCRENRHLTSGVIQKSKDGTVVCIWDSVADVHKKTNYNNWSITQCCDNKRKSAYGYYWQYAV